MSADSLSPSSRNFYERVKSKMVMSIFTGALGLLFLGFCATTGGQSQANADLGDKDNLDDHTADSYDALTTGYGFASFFFILGFLMLTATR
jgi:hypothetical protein